jgi:hypothetical protein
MKRSLAGLAALAAVLAVPAVATAHNAGHIFFPDGRCLEVGSFRDAPLVGPDGTQLDLVPQTPNPPRDEYGVSFVGYWGRTPILPGPCPAASAPPGSEMMAAGASRATPPSPAGSEPRGPFVSLGTYGRSGASRTRDTSRRER